MTAGPGGEDEEKDEDDTQLNPVQLIEPREIGKKGNKEEEDEEET